MWNHNEKTKPTIWLERIADSNVSNRLNIIHNEVEALFKVSSNDDLDKSARKKMMDSVRDIEINAMITYSSVTDSIEILLEKQETYFSLLAHGDTGFPLVFKTTNRTQTPVRPPSSQNRTPHLQIFILPFTHSQRRQQAPPPSSVQVSISEIPHPWLARTNPGRNKSSRRWTWVLGNICKSENTSVPPVYFTRHSITFIRPLGAWSSLFCSSRNPNPSSRLDLIQKLFKSTLTCHQTVHV